MQVLWYDYIFSRICLDLVLLWVLVAGSWAGLRVVAVLERMHSCGVSEKADRSCKYRGEFKHYLLLDWARMSAQAGDGCGNIMFSCSGNCWIIACLLFSIMVFIMCGTYVCCCCSCCWCCCGWVPSLSFLCCSPTNDCLKVMAVGLDLSLFNGFSLYPR